MYKASKNLFWESSKIRLFAYKLRANFGKNQRFNGQILENQNTHTN